MIKDEISGRVPVSMPIKYQRVVTRGLQMKAKCGRQNAECEENPEGV
jgi:hypothetical protein